MISHEDVADRTHSASDVTIAVLNYNGIKIIPKLFISINELDNPPAEVIMVDDGSSDGSNEWVRNNQPDVRVISMGSNTKMLNCVRNIALAEAQSDLVLIVDNDVLLAHDCVDQAVKAMNELPDAAACITRALYINDHSMIYQDGQTLHYVGATPNTNRNRPVSEASNLPRPSIGWGVQLLNKSIVNEIGNFNESYGMGWGDDGELNLRLFICGYKCYIVPAAVVYHDRAEGAKRFEGAVRNRWQFMLEMYRLRTLILALPALLLYEASQFAFLLSKGQAASYPRGIRHILENRKSIMQTRRKIQKRRVVKDSEIMGAGNIYVSGDYLNSKLLVYGLKALSGILNIYWVLIRRFV